MHLIADLEPLLLDPEPAIHHCLRGALASLGLDAPGDLRWVRSVPFVDAAMTLLDQAGGDRDDLDAFCGAYQRLFACKGRSRSGVRGAAVEALASNRSGVHYLTHIGHPQAHELIHRHGLAESVTSVFSGPTPQPRVARPEMLCNLVARLASEPCSQIAVLSDDPAELVQAAKLGCATVGLGYARVSPSHVARAKPTMMIASPDELASTLALLSAAPQTARSH